MYACDANRHSDINNFMPRTAIRLIWITAFIISVVVIFVSLFYLNEEGAAWATIAAALSVIASLASSWSAQRVLELQEDQQKPFPYPSFDMISRFDLPQLRVTNLGGGVARNINLKWQSPLLNSKGEQVRFNTEGKSEIPILLPQESVTSYIDGQLQLFQRYKGQEMNFAGEVEFEDASGKKFSHAFYLSLEKYSRGLSYTEEEPKTHHRIQQIPEKLQALTNEISHLRQAFEYANEASETQEQSQETSEEKEA